MTAIAAIVAVGDVTAMAAVTVTAAVKGLTCGESGHDGHGAHPERRAPPLAPFPAPF
ncbi:hypothetical protein ACH4C2_23005 [Streptomyces sp. NPDC018057]|uniref:hypothetical protein n=1 Tax=unclassified Streptomyces TaxID=2593676 RepID=UPI0037A3CE86